MAQLLALNGTAFPILQKTSLVGRCSESHIRIMIPEISRRHCEITENEGEFWIEDLGSRNGTFVNGLKIESKTRLGCGDKIKVAWFEMTLSELNDKGNQTISVDTD